MISRGCDIITSGNVATVDVFLRRRNGFFGISLWLRFVHQALFRGKKNAVIWRRWNLTFGEMIGYPVIFLTVVSLGKIVMSDWREKAIILNHCSQVAIWEKLEFDPGKFSLSMIFLPAFRAKGIEREAICNAEYKKMSRSFIQNYRSFSQEGNEGMKARWDNLFLLWIKW